LTGKRGHARGKDRSTAGEVQVAFKVGFIGLGIMGSRMAANLQARGYQLVVYNRSRDKADPLLRNGATWGETPASTAGDVGVLFTMLSQPDVVAADALGPSGFLQAMARGSIWVNSSTVNPSFARRMADEARTRGVRYLDAPVAGSKEVAARGELVFMVGGDTVDLETCRPLLDCMGKRIVHVGGHGLGSSLKIINNLLGAVAMAAFAEGAALGQALGVPRQTIFDILMGAPMVAPSVGAKRAKFEHEDYDTEFAMRWMHKDLHLAAISAYEAGVPMAIANVTKELYGLAMREGYGDLDMSAIYAFLNRAGHRENQPTPEVVGASTPSAR
jgi:3-hydroxyisobutyrate dehydrogenase-like beta-hydroxyacid dehydrogenase